MDDRDPKRFGRYEVLAEIGRGAMGVVYKAHDPKINRIVAVKTISLAGQRPEEEKEYRERFYREAEAAGRLSHPGIVTIFDVGEEAPTHHPYIVMEWVRGESLDKLLSRGDHKLPVEKALQLARELADALDSAHSQGVVHRDLKPENILIAEDGRAKIADFGVAKLNLANHTLAGRALGTPAYMSPEQLNGDPVDGRSDLFSLGVILYTVLTGYRPFQGNSALTVSFKVVNRDPIPATVLDTELPDGLDAIIARAMAKDPAERYQRGADLARDLRQLQERTGSSIPATRPAPTAGSAAPRVHKNENPALGNPWIAAKLLLTSRVLPLGQGVNAQALEKIRKRSVVAVVVLAALFILGLWVISFGPPAMHPRAAEPLLVPESPMQVQTATASSGPAPSSPTTSAAPAPARAASPAAKVRPTGNPPRRIDSQPVKVARAILPDAPALAPPAVVSVPPATLEIEVDHKFSQAQLSIWVDNSLTYTRALEGTDKKRLVVFHQVHGHEIHAMPIPPGKHVLRATVTTDVAGYSQSGVITGEFASAQEKVLQITFNKRGEINLSLQ